nr:MAG TPA: hypothetical protein [Caudoviricetes sp.]
MAEMRKKCGKLINRWMKIPVRNIVVLKKYALSLKKECSFLRERQKRSRKNKEKKFLKTLKTQLISTWRQKA